MDIQDTHPPTKIKENKMQTTDATENMTDSQVVAELMALEKKHAYGDWSFLNLSRAEINDIIANEPEDSWILQVARDHGGNWNYSLSQETEEDIERYERLLRHIEERYSV